MSRFVDIFWNTINSRPMAVDREFGYIEFGEICLPSMRALAPSERLGWSGPLQSPGLSFQSKISVSRRRDTTFRGKVLSGVGETRIQILRNVFFCYFLRVVSRETICVGRVSDKPPSNNGPKTYHFVGDVPQKVKKTSRRNERRVPKHCFLYVFHDLEFIPGIRGIRQNGPSAPVRTLSNHAPGARITVVQTNSLK